MHVLSRRIASLTYRVIGTRKLHMVIILGITHQLRYACKLRVGIGFLPEKTSVAS